MSYNMQEFFNIKEYFSIQITPLGANLCLLEDWVEGKIQALVKEGGHWLSQWFKEVLP